MNGTLSPFIGMESIVYADHETVLIGRSSFEPCDEAPAPSTRSDTVLRDRRGGPLDRIQPGRGCVLKISQWFSNVSHVSRVSLFSDPRSQCDRRAAANNTFLGSWTASTFLLGMLWMREPVLSDPASQIGQTRKRREIAIVACQFHFIIRAAAVAAGPDRICWSGGRCS